ncbi:hypothetical protein LEMLEM_LOCUS25957 [Lemmus lemmus]
MADVVAQGHGACVRSSQHLLEIPHPLLSTILGKGGEANGLNKQQLTKLSIELRGQSTPQTANS